MRSAAVVILVALWMGRIAGPEPDPSATDSCFLLLDTRDGTLMRDPAGVCTTRLPPASTFKIPHALAALDSGVIRSADDVITYDGSPQEYDVWRRDHTLATAMRYSVVWYFQRVAERLGIDREEFYLRRLRYGNADPSSGLTTFWLGGSLRISPEEQLTFLRRLYYDELPVSERAMQTVREILVQPAGVIVNATGEHPFDAPWPPNIIVSAKTGSTSFEQHRGVRWVVGRVQREQHAWIFVSCVTGPADVDAMAAVNLGAEKLRSHHIL